VIDVSKIVSIQPLRFLEKRRVDIIKSVTRQAASFLHHADTREPVSPSQVPDEGHLVAQYFGLADTPDERFSREAAVNAVDRSLAIAAKRPSTRCQDTGKAGTVEIEARKGPGARTPRHLSFQFLPLFYGDRGFQHLTNQPVGIKEHRFPESRHKRVAFDQADAGHRTIIGQLQGHTGASGKGLDKESWPQPVQTERFLDVPRMPPLSTRIPQRAEDRGFFAL
jgi:hypothetical protein